MRRYLIIFITHIFFFTSCLIPLSVEEKVKKKLIHAYANKINKSQGIKLFTISKNASIPVEDGADLTFFSYRKLNLEEARKLLVNSVEQLIMDTNGIELSENYKLKLDSTNLTLSIMFIQENGEYIEDQCIAHAFLLNKLVCYSIYENNSLKQIHIESYQKALGIVNWAKANECSPD